LNRKKTKKSLFDWCRGHYIIRDTILFFYCMRLEPQNFVGAEEIGELLIPCQLVLTKSQEVVASHLLVQD